MSQPAVPIAVQVTYRSKDEKAWERQQRRKRRTAPLVEVPATGPCCGRCRHWRTPEHADDVGSCRRLRIMASGRDKGTIFTVDEEHGDLVGIDEPLDTRSGFHCSLYADPTTLTLETNP